MNSKNDKDSLGRTIADRLKGFVEAVESGEDPCKRFTCRTVRLNLEPHSYDAELVKNTRETLRASQAIFAQFLGVSINCVHDWEQGRKKPHGVACRVMDEIRRNPEYWQQRLRDCATPLTS